jgi:phage-related protein
MVLVVTQKRFKTPPDPASPFLPPFDYDYSVKGPPVERVYYTDGQGAQTDLSTIENVQYKQGLDGRFMAPVENYSDVVPGQDGARFRGTSLLPSQLTLTLLVVADDITTLRVRMRELAQRLHPKKGMGTLTVLTEDGLARYVNCVYESGFEADPATEGFQYEQTVVLVFRAFDPTWYELQPVTRPFQNNVSEGTFFPGPPWRIGSSSIYSLTTETNTGDEIAWPVWYIRGPGENLTLRNNTTDEELLLEYELTSSSQIVVDTRPEYIQITESGTINLFPYATGALWSLVPGLNEISILFTGTTGSTRIDMSYQRRFVGV